MAHCVLTLTGANVRGNAILARPRGVQRVRMDQGEPLAKQVKANTTFPFDDDFPDGRKLLDAVPNSFFAFPISPKLKEIFAEEPSIEFIPIQIADHRKKVVAKDYVLANPLDPVDCIDLGKSDVVMDALEPTEIFRIKKLALVPGKVPKDRHVFRLAGRKSMLLLSPKIVKAIEAAKITGVECVPVDKFNSTGKIGV